MSLCSACGLPAKNCLIFLIVLTTALCAVAGAKYQHDQAVAYFNELIQTDPYAFYLRDKIFNAFKIFPVDINSLPRLDSTRTPIARIMKYGFPGMDCLISYSDFMLSYDRRNRVAHWVYEHVTPESLNETRGNLGRRYAEYQPDMRVASMFRSTNDDYWRSGYDRGHLASSGNHRRTQSQCNETFFLTNMTPQVGKGFNKDAWHRLELYTRAMAAQHGSVYVCSGPLYLPRQYQVAAAPSTYYSRYKPMVEYELIGERSVAVPTHFFKVLIIESIWSNAAPVVEAYLMPNRAIPDDTDRRAFLCDVREVERAAGLKFHIGLRENQFQE